MMNYIPKPLVTLLAIAAVNVNALVNIRLSASLPPLAFIKSFSPRFYINTTQKETDTTKTDLSVKE